MFHQALSHQRMMINSLAMLFKFFKYFVDIPMLNNSEKSDDMIALPCCPSNNYGEPFIMCNIGGFPLKLKICFLLYWSHLLIVALYYHNCYFFGSFWFLLGALWLVPASGMVVKTHISIDVIRHMNR